MRTAVAVVAAVVLTVFGQSLVGADAPKAVQRWEYRCLVRPSPRNDLEQSRHEDPELWQKDVDTLGAEGWELVAVPGMINLKGVHAIFKRPLR